MRFFRRSRSIVTMPLIFSLLVSTFSTTAFAAKNIATDQLIEDSLRLQERQDLRDFLDRDEVRRQMISLGVDPEEALARIDSYSDDEIRHLTGQLDALPAGGDALGTIVGAALTVFLVLLITDLLCLTSFFSFTKCVR